MSASVSANVVTGKDGREVIVGGSDPVTFPLEDGRGRYASPC